MKYMLMLIGPENWAEGMSESQLREKLAKHVAFSEELRASGKSTGEGEKLQPSSEAVTIRRAPDGLTVVDGPFAETKDLLGGFYLLDVDSREEAVEWASKLPLVDGTFVEVRPCRTGAQGGVPVRGKHKYMALFVQGRGRRPSREEVFASIDRHYELSLELAVQGRYVASRSLAPQEEASTLVWRDGRPLPIDGPYAETKEVLVGYFVLACDDRAEAVEWAKQLMLGVDACEVRPVHQF